MKEQLSIALFQQDIAWEDPDANYLLVNNAFANIQDCDILVVPETFNTGFGDHMALQAEQPLGPTFDFAVEMARLHDALFVGTWTVRDQGVVYNRMHLVQPDGQYHYYDKAHTFRMSSEASQIARGRRHPLVQWRGWTICPAICYDLRFPKWLRNTPNLDYHLMIVCANWPGSRHEAWTTLLKARAIENLAYVAGCNRIGTDSTGINYAGRSAIIDYRGIGTQAPPPAALVRRRPRPRQGEIFQSSLSASKLLTFRSHWPFNLDFD